MSNCNNMSMETKIEILDSPPNPYEKQEEDDICELEHLRKLFIGGLAPYTNEEGLKSFYGQWGKVVDVVVMRDPNTKRSRGFGFITFTKSSMVDKAQENRPHVIDGKTVEAKRALPRPEREARETNISVKKLFVGGLKDNHDEECLKEYFAHFGNVVSVKILTDKTTGKRRGFAFIEYDDYDAVDKAILQRNHSIKYVVVDVKKSVYNYEQSKRQNSSQLQQQQSSNITVTNNTHSLKSTSSSTASGSYRHPAPPPPPQGVSHQHPPPVSGPPPNYNCWGPPTPAVQNQYYQQTPPQTWNYPPNSWNAPPIHPTPAIPNWHTNPWGCPPPAAPGATPIRPPGVAPYPFSNWHSKGNGVVNTPNNSQQPALNFGSNYQQKYSGGPTKHNIGNNRMNPYNVPSANNQQPMIVGYGNYNNGHPNVNFGNTNSIAMPNGGNFSGLKYRR